MRVSPFCVGRDLPDNLIKLAGGHRLIDKDAKGEKNISWRKKYFRGERKTTWHKKK
jgi:hypothetical protein